MEKGNTKQEILEAALNLFSVQGFEATSISQLAEAVGIRKASLYSHFESKQAILDALVQDILEQYTAHSIFARADWDDPAFLKQHGSLTADKVVGMIQGQVRYILHDPDISRGRKMLVIEQFQNPKLAELQTKQNYTDVLRYFTGLIRHLIHQGILVDADPEIMSAQFCLPVTAWINLCDREPEREGEVMALIDRHIRQFFTLYQPNTAPASERYSAYKVENLYGKNYSGFTRKVRKASRSVILSEGKILLSHEKKIERWMIPGGGLEAGETPEDACIREAAEETGKQVVPGNCYLVLNEFYEDWKYVTYYFTCDVVGETDRNPTKQELEVGAEPEWIPLQQALDIFSRHPDYEGSDEERRGIYQREYLALSEVIRT